MKEVKITHAEVIKFFGTDDIIKEFPTEKGKLLVFNIKTKINDRNEKSPFIFNQCKFYATADEQITKLKQTILLGNIVEIEGYEGSYPYNDKAGKKQYKPEINVTNITPINIVTNNTSTTNSIDDLPF